jgi:hypothetical protein
LRRLSAQASGDGLRRRLNADVDRIGEVDALGLDETLLVILAVGVVTGLLIARRRATQRAARA